MLKNSMFTILFFLCISSSLHAELQSTCYGTTKNGRLENGVKLPAKGKNFVHYSSVGVMAGRTYAHSKVSDVIVKTYESLHKTYPDKIYMYGETGFKDSGEFKPHKTHQSSKTKKQLICITY